MDERITKRLLIVVAAAVFLVIAGLGALLFIVGERHDRSIGDQAHAVAVLGRINDARAILLEQEVAILASPQIALDRAQLQAWDEQFQRTFGDPGLLRTPTGRRLQEQILAADRAFMAGAMALPRRPGMARTVALGEQAGRIQGLLRDLGRLHRADLTAILTTERQQRDLTAGVFVAFGSATLVLMVASFLLLGRLGEQRARARALEVADQLRNEFVSFAAHELRNPATVISSGVSLLRRSDTDPQMRDKALDAMVQSASALGRLVMNLLNMGRVEEGKLHLHRERVALAQLVGDVIDELSTYHSGLSERVQIGLPNVPVEVDKDYARLVLSNVLSNAVRFSPPDSPIRISGELADGMATVHIRDEGAGIPADRLPHVFRKYETTEMAPQGAHRGTGLGLYMARLLVEAHGGTIWAESEAGRGATISFTLPLAQPDGDRGQHAVAR